MADLRLDRGLQQVTQVRDDPGHFCLFPFLPETVRGLNELLNDPVVGRRDPSTGRPQHFAGGIKRLIQLVQLKVCTDQSPAEPIRLYAVQTGRRGQDRLEIIQRRSGIPGFQRHLTSRQQQLQAITRGQCVHVLPVNGGREDVQPQAGRLSELGHLSNRSQHRLGGHPRRHRDQRLTPGLDAPFTLRTVSRQHVQRIGAAAPTDRRGNHDRLDDRIVHAVGQPVQRPIRVRPRLRRGLLDRRVRVVHPADDILPVILVADLAHQRDHRRRGRTPVFHVFPYQLGRTIGLRPAHQPGVKRRRQRAGRIRTQGLVVQKLDRRVHRLTLRQPGHHPKIGTQHRGDRFAFTAQDLRDLLRRRFVGQVPQTKRRVRPDRWYGIIEPIPQRLSQRFFKRLIVQQTLTDQLHPQTTDRCQRVTQHINQHIRTALRRVGLIQRPLRFQQLVLELLVIRTTPGLASFKVLQQMLGPFLRPQPLVLLPPVLPGLTVGIVMIQSGQYA